MARLVFLRRLGRRGARRRHRGGGDDDDDDSSRSSDSGSDASFVSDEDSSAASSGTGSSDASSGSDGSSVNEVTTVTSYSSEEEEDDDWSDDDSEDSELQSSDGDDSRRGRKRGLRRLGGLFPSRHRRRRHRRGAQLRSPLSAAAARPEADADAAERLRRELEGLGYDLNCNSFITRGSSKNGPPPPEERYNNGLADENESRLPDSKARKASGVKALKGLFVRNKLSKTEPVTEEMARDDENADDGDIRSKATWEGKFIEISADIDGYSASLLRRNVKRDGDATGEFTKALPDARITSSASQATNTSSKLRGRRRRKVKTSVISRMTEKQKTSNKNDRPSKQVDNSKLLSNQSKPILKSPVQRELNAKVTAQARSPAAAKSKDPKNKSQSVFFAMSAKKNVGSPFHDDLAQYANKNLRSIALSSEGIEEDYEAFLRALSPRSSKAGRLPPPPPKISTSAKDVELTQPVIIEGMNIVFASQDVKSGKRSQKLLIHDGLVDKQKRKSQMKEEKMLLCPFAEPSPLSEPDPNPRRQKFAMLNPARSAAKLALPFVRIKKKGPSEPDQGEKISAFQEPEEIQDKTDLSLVTGPQLPTMMDKSEDQLPSKAMAIRESFPTEAFMLLPKACADYDGSVDKTESKTSALNVYPVELVGENGVPLGCPLTPNKQQDLEEVNNLVGAWLSPLNGINKATSNPFQTAASHQDDENEGQSIEPGQIEVTYDQQLCISSSEIQPVAELNEVHCLSARQRSWSPKKWKQKQIVSPIQTNNEPPFGSPTANVSDHKTAPDTFVENTGKTSTSSAATIPQIEAPLERKSALVRFRDIFPGNRQKSARPSVENHHMRVNMTPDQHAMISLEALSRLSPTTKAKVVEAILMPRNGFSNSSINKSFSESLAELKHNSKSNNHGSGLPLQYSEINMPSKQVKENDKNLQKGLWHDMMEALDFPKPGDVACSTRENPLSEVPNWTNAAPLSNERSYDSFNGILSVEDATDLEPSENVPPPVQAISKSQKVRSFLGMRLSRKLGERGGNASADKSSENPSSRFAVEYNDDNNVPNYGSEDHHLRHKKTAENVVSAGNHGRQQLLRNSTYDESNKDWTDGSLVPKSSTLTSFPASAQRRSSSRLPSVLSNDSTYTWADVADASTAVEKVIERIDTSKSGDDIDESVKLKSLLASLSEEQSVGDIEMALKTLQRHAARLGLRETDILMALESSDTLSLGDNTEKSYKDLTLAQEILHVLSMYMPGAKI